MKHTTIHDVAELAGVSIGTVSAVINHRSTVSKATRLRVQQAIKQLNYRPSAAARRRLQPATEKTLGLLVKEISNPYFAEIIIGVQEEAVSKGYQVLVTSSERNFEMEHRLVETLIAKDVDGLIINPLQDDEMDLSHLFEIRRRNIPLVMLESIRGLQASMVDVDNVAASRAAVEHLISGGHTRIIHFGGPPYSMHSDERIEGVRRAFSAQHLAFGDDDVVHVGARLEDGYAAGLKYFRDLSEPERPTAVTCYNDLVAIGLMRALTELGLKVPDDISIIGYDDIDMATYGPIPLTTVRVPKKEMGRRSAQILIQHVEAHDAGTIEKVFLEPKMIVRESTRVIEAVQAGKR